MIGPKLPSDEKRDNLTLDVKWDNMNNKNTHTDNTILIKFTSTYVARKSRVRGINLNHRIPVEIMKSVVHHIDKFTTASSENCGTTMGNDHSKIPAITRNKIIKIISRTHPWPTENIIYGHEVWNVCSILLPD